MSVEIIKVTNDHIDDLAAMFNEYRQFYRQSDDLASSKAFLQQRLENNESVAYIARLDGQAAGFVHLYPSYSSIYLQLIWTLNDLYVRRFARRQGVGFALLDAAKALAQDSNAKLIKLSTEQRNITAQKVYESTGYRRDFKFFHYHLPINGKLD